MKKLKPQLLLIALATGALLLSACKASTQKSNSSASATNAIALTSASSGTPSASGLPPASTSVVPSPNASLSPVKPSLSVTVPPVSPLPSASTSPAKPSAGLVSPGGIKPQATLAPELASPFKFEEKTYTSGVISIKYPQIVGYSDQAVQTKLNKLIADSAQRDLAALKDETTLAAYEIKDTISLNSPSLISICFDGYSDYQGAAHPNRFFYSVNIDVKKQQTVALSQLVNVSKDFVKLLQDADLRPNGIDLTPDYVAAVKDSLNNMGSDYVVQELKKADTSGDFFSFFTKDALGISVSVGHAMGDYAEFMIKFNALQGFKTNDALWKELMK